jgi:hypothetical protein
MEPVRDLVKLAFEELIYLEGKALHFSGGVSLMTTGSLLAAVGEITGGSLNELRG